MPTSRHPADLERLFGHLALTSRTALVAAVSGGSDSLALLVLLHAYLARLPRPPKLVVVTIDHGLRAESASEARFVASFAAGLGTDHITRVWDAQKPSTGLAAAAREARYRLLDAAAQEIGTDLVLTGHTADDQAETVAMRAERGGGRGLAGMAGATLFDGRSWILRPLLGVHRETLRTLLRGQGAHWIEDPTNFDRRYERPRLRERLSADGSVVDRLCRQADAAAAQRLALGEQAASLIAMHGALIEPGVLRLSAAFAKAGDAQARLYALRILLAAVGGLSQLPDAGRVEMLMRRFAETGARATLARTLIEMTGDGVLLSRERRNLPPPQPAQHRAIWDGRWRLIGDASSPYATVEAAVLSGSRAFQPCFVTPEPNGWRAMPVLAPWSRFLPSFDWAPACALAAILGAKSTPPLPILAGSDGEP